MADIRARLDGMQRHPLRRHTRTRCAHVAERETVEGGDGYGDDAGEAAEARSKGLLRGGAARTEMRAAGVAPPPAAAGGRNKPWEGRSSQLPLQKGKGQQAQC